MAWHGAYCLEMSIQTTLVSVFLVTSLLRTLDSRPGFVVRPEMGPITRPFGEHFETLVAFLGACFVHLPVDCEVPCFGEGLAACFALVLITMLTHMVS